MSSLPSRSPTRCADATGRSGSPRSAPRAVWRTGWCPPAATSWRSSPRCRSRASRVPTCGGHRAGCGRRSARRPRCCATTTRTCSSASAATSPVRPTSPPAGSGADRRARGQPAARLGEPPGCAPHPPRRDQLPGHPHPPRPVRRAADPPVHRHPGPDRPAAGGARGLRAGRGPPDAARHRRLARGAPAQRGRLGRCLGPGRCGDPGAARVRAPQRGRGRDRARRPAVRRRALPGPDGPGLRGRRPGAVPGRGQHGQRDGRGRAAGGLRPAADRQRRAGADRRAGRGRRWRTDGHRRGLHPDLGARHADPPADRPRSVGDDGCAPRRGSAGRTPTSAWPTWCSTTASSSKGAARP